jgi:hypothetical protein
MTVLDVLKSAGREILRDDGVIRGVVQIVVSLADLAVRSLKENTSQKSETSSL